MKHVQPPMPGQYLTLSHAGPYQRGSSNDGQLFCPFRARLHDSTVGPLYNENRVQGPFDAKVC